MEQLRELAAVHIQTIPYSINARLGLDHLHELYTLFKDSNEIFGFVAVEENQAIGLVLASRNFKVSSSVAKPIRKRLIKEMASAKFLFENFSNLVDFALVSAKISKRFSESSYLMLWYVDQSWSGKGIGKILLDKLCNETKDRNFYSVVVDVRRTSKAAISGYSEHGFRPVSETFLSRIYFQSLEE